jgi:glycyl-tRNA synthetase
MQFAGQFVHELHRDRLRSRDYDQSGAIGRRYRRQDEAGTPFCVTIDYESKENSTVTLRFRDSMEQVRVPRAELGDRLRAEIKNYKRST